MSTIVVKFGGHAMSDEAGHFAQSIQSAIAAGHKVVVVHGGGPQINRALDTAGITSVFIGGFRVTTPEIFAVVERVLAREVGPAIAENLKSHGIAATALSGRDGIIFAVCQKTLVNGDAVDLGRVGDVQRAEGDAVTAVLNSNAVPVISPIAQDIDSSEGLNVNADIAAAAIAGALSAQELIIMTDVAGIYRAWPDTTSLISAISVDELKSIKSTFAEGMAPKVQACIDAIDAGACAVRIIDGRTPEPFAQALTGEGGTLVHL